jgi:pimeloyl-ACP methyl ester carboxylesterase
MDTVRRISPSRRVIAPDLPGHGQSDRWHPPGDISLAMYRDAVGTLCANLKLDKVVLLGHSMGGMIALACAAAWPERVAGLVLVGSGMRVPVAPRLFEVFEQDWPHAPAWFARLSFSPASPRELVERWSGLLVTAEQEITIADFRAVDRFDAQALLPRIGVPVLLVAGADDLLTPPSLAHQLQTGLPKAHAVVLPEAGHVAMLEQSDLFHQELRTFLTSIPYSRNLDGAR